MAAPKRKNNKSKEKTPKSELSKQIKIVFSENHKKTFNYKQVSSVLGVETPRQKEMVRSILINLKEEKIIVEVSRGKYKLNSIGGYAVGRLEREGVKSYVVPDGGGAPIYIPEKKMGTAMLHDKVKVFIYASRKNRDPEGEVVEVLKRVKDTFVGELEVSEKFAFLNVANKALNSDILIPLDKLNGGKTGQKAMVRITEWKHTMKSPIGEVVDILGDKGDNNTEMHAILAEFGLPYSYPEKIEQLAKKIEPNVTKEEIFRRYDMRHVPTFTIDPKDAKDFDDALSIRYLEKESLWEVGVHIADVTYYIKNKSTIDEEAKKRATSVYLVDRTVPMLPEHLSNYVCSLRPGEEKLCYSVIFKMDEYAEVRDYQITETVIKSDRRFDYEEAQSIIESGEGDFSKEILKLNEFAKNLRSKRFRSGAIAFDRVEVKFNIDEAGKPLNVYFSEAKDSNKLIEELMLLANRTVATHIARPGKGNKVMPFVYRVHDVPDQEKLENFAVFIKKFGYNLNVYGRKTQISNSINKLLEQVVGKNEQNLVETLAIRSMAKAIYTTENIGHYGLAFENYTHFTSPIRRYPDMMVHRLLKRYKNGGKGGNLERLEEACEHSSHQEQLAANAERASIKYKQVEFMADKIGQTFDGVVSGITEWGVYVEIIENKCEGMIPIRDLDDDFYILDEKNYCLVGRIHHKKYQLGDPLTIRVAKANLDKKQLDFALA